MAVDWTRDEILLTVALVQSNDWQGLTADDERVVELSILLRSLPIHSPAVRDAKFRNPNGVARKSWDIATAHPQYSGRPTNGGHLTREIVAECVADASVVGGEAAALRAGAAGGKFDPGTELLNDEAFAHEGGLLMVLHKRRERSSRLRRQKLNATRRAGLPVACEVCSFNFEHTYGPLGTGYIEIHHVRPLHDSGPTTTKLSDLALLCSNCHRMIHRARPWLLPAQLEETLRPAISTTSDG